MNEMVSGSVEKAVEDLLLASGQLLRRLRLESNPSELSWSQSAVLARLARDGGMTTAQLARTELVKPQSMGAVLGCLEREGLVWREPDPTDGRQVIFDLSDEGRALWNKNRLLRRTWLAAAIAGLDASDQEILVSASAVIRRLSES